MIFAHAAYGFGAIYLEFGFFKLLWIWVKNLRSRAAVIERFSLDKVTIRGDTAGCDRTAYLARFLSEKDCVFHRVNLAVKNVMFNSLTVWTFARQCRTYPRRLAQHSEQAAVFRRTGKGSKQLDYFNSGDNEQV